MQNFAARFNAEACEHTSLRNLIVVNGHAARKRRAGDFAGGEWLEDFATELAEADTGRDEMAFWMYSSGSTGRPKGIVHLQHDMAYSEQAFARNVLQLKPDDICFSVPKIFFAYGFGNSITFPFSVGAATLLLPGQPKPSTIFAAIEHFRPTAFLRTADALHVADQGRWRRRDRFLFTADGAVGGRSSSADVFNGWKTLTGLDIVEGLGSTEVLHIYLSNRPDRRSSAQRACACRAMKSCCATRTAAMSATARRAFCGCAANSNTPLYWNRPDKSAETIREGGWIYTGDRFVRDHDGFHFFRGRADDLIKISGQWVYPLEVELCLAEHPDIRECAVYAAELPDRRMTLKAVVVMNSAAFDAMRRRKRCRITSRRNCCRTNTRARLRFSMNCRRPAPGRSTARR